MNIKSVDAAEKEASEVLHSLLSVERIENPLHRLHGQLQQVMVGDNRGGVEDQQRRDGQEHWNTNLLTSTDSANGSLHHHGFSHLDHQAHVYQWDNQLGLNTRNSMTQGQQTVECYQSVDSNRDPQSQNKLRSYSSNINPSTIAKVGDSSNKSSLKKEKKVIIRKKHKKGADDHQKAQQAEHHSVRIEDSAHEVRERFLVGCECQEDCCFEGLSAENVYKHRLNIAELTKEEHDMYLMGVTMACMADPGVTAKQRKRRRLRAQYVYQGRRVCLCAFLYLENCTLYQLKRIRKHVMTHGVAPRVHGNHGKKPHNVFPLATYRKATEFLKSYIDKNCVGLGNVKSPLMFPSDITRKTIHNLYKEIMQETVPPGEKTMGYSTFRHFMKEQFPQVKFLKPDSGVTTSSINSNNAANNNNNSNNTFDSSSITNNISSLNNVNQKQMARVNNSSMHQQHDHHHNINNNNQHQQQQILTPCVTINAHAQNINANDQQQTTISGQVATSPLSAASLTQSACAVTGGTIVPSTQMATIPVILSETSKADLTPQQTTFIVSPVSQLMPAFQSVHAITITPITNTAYAFCNDSILGT